MVRSEPRVGTGICGKQDNINFDYLGVIENQQSHTYITEKPKKANLNDYITWLMG